VFYLFGGASFFFCRSMAKWSSIDLVCCAGFFLFSILSIAAGFFLILFFCTRLRLVCRGEELLSLSHSAGLWRRKKESGEEI